MDDMISRSALLGKLDEMIRKNSGIIRATLICIRCIVDTMPGKETE